MRSSSCAWGGVKKGFHARRDWNRLKDVWESHASGRELPSSSTVMEGRPLRGVPDLADHDHTDTALERHGLRDERAVRRRPGQPVLDLLQPAAG